MSKTRIDYNAVVKELSKGLIALDSEEALRCSMAPHIALSEFRTIRYGAGRQKGVTTHALDIASKFNGNVLYLLHSLTLREEIMKRYQKLPSKSDSLTIMCGYLPENWRSEKFGLVVVDEASFFFNKFSYSKVYRSLVDVVTPDVVIHLIN